MALLLRREIPLLPSKPIYSRHCGGYLAAVVDCSVATDELRARGEAVTVYRRIRQVTSRRCVDSRQLAAVVERILHGRCPLGHRPSGQVQFQDRCQVPECLREHLQVGHIPVAHGQGFQLRAEVKRVVQTRHIRRHESAQIKARNTGAVIEHEGKARRLACIQLGHVKARAVPEHVEPVSAALRLNRVDELHRSYVVVLAIPRHLAVRCVDRVLEVGVHLLYRHPVIH